MIDTFDNFVAPQMLEKYQVEITSYASSIRYFKGANVKVHLLSPFDDCGREEKSHAKKATDVDPSVSRMGLNPSLMECAMFLSKDIKYNWKVLKQTASIQNNKRSCTKWLKKVKEQTRYDSQ